MINLATIRVEKISDYTTLSNRFLDDDRLSLKAIGLLSYMLRLPDDWNFTLEWLAGKHKDGLFSVRSAMEELEAAGYVTRGQSREGGRFSENEYIVRELPQDPDQEGAPSCGNRTTVTLPSCSFPITGKPIAGNRTQPSTIEPSTKEPIPPCNPPEGKAPKPPKPKKAKGDPKPGPDWMPERFAAFWDAYPRGEAKQAAIRAWDKLRPDSDLLTSMAKGLRRQLLSKEWQEGIGIPYASTWLNQRRWTDTGTKPVGQAPAAESRGEVGDRW